jgi:hypothetical protein
LAAVDTSRDLIGLTTVEQSRNLGVQKISG